MTGRQARNGVVRYAVVGAGWISQAAFMPGVANTGNSVITAVVTGDDEKAKGLARRYDARAYSYDDYQRMIDEDVADAVYLALPNSMHLDYALPALRAGMHLLLEKPMATSSADCEAITGEAARSGAKLMVAYRLHFEPATLEAIRLVHSGVLGTPRVFSAVFTQFVSASNHRAHGGFWAGPVPDMGPYPINAVRHLFDAEPEEVSAAGLRCQGMEFDDTVSVTLRFPGSRLAQFVVGYGPSGVNQYRIVGDKGDLEVSPAFLFGPGVGLAHRLTVDGKTTARDFPPTDQFGAEAQYFSECILAGRDPEPDGEEGLADVRVCEAIERALATGRAQPLAPMQRARHPTPDMARSLPPIELPALINASEPGQG